MTHCPYQPIIEPSYRNEFPENWYSQQWSTRPMRGSQQLLQSVVSLSKQIYNITDRVHGIETYFTFDSRAEQQTEVYLRYGQHPELYPNRRGEVVQGSYCEREYRDCRLQTCYVQSPAYPGLYPRALNCRYKLHTRQPYIKLYLQNEQFAVDGQR
uniref:CUB domain-containing protein n=1 Tax=Glossina palpalis gambiensis TaxID=67801 RepID=A0A1B0BRK7_9MUSC